MKNQQNNQEASLNAWFESLPLELKYFYYMSQPLILQLLATAPIDYIQEEYKKALPRPITNKEVSDFRKYLNDNNFL